MAPDRDRSATPLWRKLGLKPGRRLFVSALPSGPVRSNVAELLDEFPPARHPNGVDVHLFFTTSRDRLASTFQAMALSLPPHGGLWIAWPKKSSKIQTDLAFTEVQRIGLEAGLVDNKSCSIDDDWQAVRFVYRVKDRPTAGR